MRKKLVSLCFAFVLLVQGILIHATPLKSTNKNLVTTTFEGEDLVQEAERIGIPVYENGMRLVKIVREENMDLKSKGPSKDQAVHSIRNARSTAILHTGEVIAEGRAYGGESGCTLSISTTRSVASQYSTTVGVSTSLISSSVGFSVTDSYSIDISNSQPVRPHFYGKLQAMPLFDHWTYDIYHDENKVGRGTADKPYGAEFRYYEYL